MPDQRTEGWRRTSLRGLPRLDSLSPLPRVPTPSSFVEEPLAEQAGASLFAFKNGMSMREDGTESGWVMDLQEALAEPLLAMRIEKHFGKIVPPTPTSSPRSTTPSSTVAWWCSSRAARCSKSQSGCATNSTIRHKLPSSTRSS